MTPKNAARYDTTTPLIDVYLHAPRMGGVGEHDTDVWFRYLAPHAGETAPAHALSVRMPPRAATYSHADTLVFFDNLLLESDTRDELARLEQHDRTDVAGLLGRVGGECAGAVSVWPHNAVAPATHTYRAFSEDELATLFDERHGERLTQAQLDSRQVMSGVQRKLVFRWLHNRWHLPLNGAPGTHILKRTSGRYDGLVANELACLHLYKSLGLPVPAARAIGSGPDRSPYDDGDDPHEPLLIAIERFDRVEVQGESVHVPRVRKLHQEDMCQVTGRLPRRKYQRDGGPGLHDLAVALRRFSIRPATDLQHLLTATIANVCLGNTDAHGKNFALLYTEEGVQLAPFYDVVSTEVYPSLSPNLSMRVGTGFVATALGAHDVKKLAADFGVAPALVRATIERTTTTIRDVLDDVLQTTQQHVGGEARVLERMRRLIGARIPIIERMALTR